MEIIPAIDLKGGKCVRLYQGDFNKEQVYSENPAEVAKAFEENGATRLHIVDLDGAAQGHPVNLGIYRDIAKSIQIPIQVGGGIRTKEIASRVMDAGVDRLVLGTTSVEDPMTVESICLEYGMDAVAISLDTRDGMVAVRGWQATTPVTAVGLIGEMASMGIRNFIFTDISRDGTLTEPNWEKIILIVNQARTLAVEVIASGGISSVDHLRELANIGVHGAIIGKALYVGTFSLKDALAAAQA
jgi:phosphoribosylformimino-5-aminoimidazole carboxamide ribotide isomerase